jgi:hypothetical protein
VDDVEFRFLATVCLKVRIAETSLAAGVPPDQVNVELLKPGAVRSARDLELAAQRTNPCARPLTLWIEENLSRYTKPTTSWDALIGDPPDFIKVIRDEGAERGAVIIERLPSGVWASQATTFTAFAQRRRDIIKTIKTRGAL